MLLSGWEQTGGNRLRFGHFGAGTPVNTQHIIQPYVQIRVSFKTSDISLGAASRARADVCGLFSNAYMRSVRDIWFFRTNAVTVCLIFGCGLRGFDRNDYPVVARPADCRSAMQSNAEARRTDSDRSTDPCPHKRTAIGGRMGQ